MTERPMAVTILGALNILVGVFILITFVGLSLVGATGGISGAVLAAIIIGVIFGGIYLVIGYGMLQGWSIMWWIGLIVNVISIAGATWALLKADYTEVLRLALSIIIIYYLFRPHVKSFFRV